MELTIVTVVYNSLDMLKKTYTCLRSQSVKDFKWIIKDNLSTDGTKEFIQEIKSEFKQIYYINQRDSGIYNAMNQTLNTGLADKGILTFLNAGDIYSSDFTLQDIINNCNEKAIIIAIPVIVEGNIRHQRLISKNTVNNICHQATFYNLKHPKLKEKIKYDEKYKLCADFELLLKLYSLGDIQYLTDIGPVIYDTTGVSSMLTEKRLKEKFQIVAKAKLPYLCKIFTLVTILKEIIKNVFSRNFIK